MFLKYLRLLAVASMTGSLSCAKCGRAGQYRKQKLIEPRVALPSARWRGTQDFW